jgi:hypothetical protein
MTNGFHVSIKTRLAIFDDRLAILSGCVAGGFLPIPLWFGPGNRIWIVLVGVVIALDAFCAGRILDWAVPDAHKAGCTKEQLLTAADAPETTSLKRFFAYLSFVLIGKALFLCGILAGVAFSIYLGKYK